MVIELELAGRKFRVNRDPWSAATHFAGFLAAIVGLIILITKSAGDGPRLASTLIYGISLALLFLASASYHFFDLGAEGNKWLRKLDHSAIYLLIAGTYVPSLIHLLGGTWRVVMLAIVGSIALLGVCFKLFIFNTKNKAGTILYVVMGWLVVVPAYQMWPVISAESFAWLVSGGVAYTVGALVYARKWPDPWPNHFGFHEVWHLFVLLGATLHYFFVLSLMEVRYPPFA